MAIFALVDCNNFYCSCERAFNPKLAGKPVIVLSNNDGCAIARSEEAKSLGIKMGEPLFKFEHLIKRHHIEVFSANFCLYGDISNRIIKILAKLVPDIEIYSIDECFLSLDISNQKNLVAFAKSIKKTILSWTGIPVSIGISRTKTLCKIANRIAKKNLALGGICQILEQTEIDNALKNTRIENVWGIGFQYARFLSENGINTAYELKTADDLWIRKHMSVVGQRTVWELNSVSCLALEEVQTNKNICCSRSFGQPIRALSELEEAISSYTSRAAEKLRQQNSVVSLLHIFLRTNPFKTNEKQYNPCTQQELSVPTSYSPALVKCAINLLRKIYKEGLNYHKAGVILMNLSPNTQVQDNLFEPETRLLEKRCLMNKVDRLNKFYGRDTVKVASSGTKHRWKTRQRNKSPNYTTSWNELPLVS